VCFAPAQAENGLTQHLFLYNIPLARHEELIWERDVLQGFHIHNNFDMSIGKPREKGG